jgi:hypothetical protein
MPSPAFGAGPTPGVSGCISWFPLGIPSPEKGAGPTAELATPAMESTVKDSIATTTRVQINFFISITTYQRK